MIKHLVLFRLADEALGRSKEENALLVKEKLEALKGVIPQIRKMEVRVNHADASSENYDLLLESEFASFSDLNAYAVHPAHLEVGAFVVKVRIARAAFDYEM